MCSAVQCSAVQCSAVQCSAVQCSAVQCSAVQCRVPRAFACRPQNKEVHVCFVQHVVQHELAVWIPYLLSLVQSWCMLTVLKRGREQQQRAGWG
jgi:hypothetical protein